MSIAAVHRGLSLLAFSRDDIYVDIFLVVSLTKAQTIRISDERVTGLAFGGVGVPRLAVLSSSYRVELFIADDSGMFNESGRFTIPDATFISWLPGHHGPVLAATCSHTISFWNTSPPSNLGTLDTCLCGVGKVREIAHVSRSHFGTVHSQGLILWNSAGKSKSATEQFSVCRGPQVHLGDDLLDSHIFRIPEGGHPVSFASCGEGSRAIVVCIDDRGWLYVLGETGVKEELFAWVVEFAMKLDTSLSHVALVPQVDKRLDSPTSTKTPLRSSRKHVESHSLMHELLLPVTDKHLGNTVDEYDSVPWSVYVISRGKNSVFEVRFDTGLSSDPRLVVDATVASWYVESGITELPVSLLIPLPVMSEEHPVLVSHPSVGYIRLVTQSRPVESLSVSVNPVIDKHADHLLALTSAGHLRIYQLSSPAGLDAPLAMRCGVTMAAWLGDRLLYCSGNQLKAARIAQGCAAWQTDPLITEAINCESDTSDVDTFWLGPSCIWIKHANNLVAQYHWTVGDTLSLTMQTRLPACDGFCLETGSTAQIHGHDVVINANVVTGAAPVVKVALHQKFIAVYLSSGLLQIFNLLDSTLKFTATVAMGKAGLRFKELTESSTLCIFGAESRVIVLTRSIDAGEAWRAFNVPEIRGSIAFDVIGCRVVFLKMDGSVFETELPGDLSDGIASSKQLPEDDSTVLMTLCSLGDYKRILPRLPKVIADLFQDDAISRACDYPARQFLLHHLPDHTKACGAVAISWASLSTCQPYLLQRISAGGVKWAAISQAGVSFWLKPSKELLDLCESFYKAGVLEYKQSKNISDIEDKAAVWLAVLEKQQVLAALFKQHGQVSSDPKASRVSEFLSQDFRNSVSASKGIKNAIELVRQKRYHLACAVFILCEDLESVLDVCCRCLNDLCLGLMLLKAISINSKSAERAQKAKDLVSVTMKTRAVEYFKTRIIESSLKLSERDWVGMLECFTAADATANPMTVHLVEYMTQSARAIDPSHDSTQSDQLIATLRKAASVSLTERRLEAVVDSIGWSNFR